MDEKPVSTIHLWGISGRGLIVILLALVAAGLAAELIRSPAQAEAQVTGVGQSGKILAVAGKITSDTYGLYLIDRESGIITVYQWIAGRPGKLKLAAARNCSFDLELDEYNTEPSPSEIKSLVRQGRRLRSSEPR